MATKVDLNKPQLARAIECLIASLKRDKYKDHPIMGPILDRDLYEYSTALNTMQETK